MKKIFLLFCTLFLFTSNVFAASINVQEESGIYHIILSGNSIKKQIQFVSTVGLKTNKEIHDLTKSKLTINTGFFDPMNQKTISYIVNKGVIIEYLNFPPQSNMRNSLRLIILLKFCLNIGFVKIFSFVYGSSIIHLLNSDVI